MTWAPFMVVDTEVHVLQSHSPENQAYVAWAPALNLYVSCWSMEELRVAAPAAVKACLERRHNRNLAKTLDGEEGW